MARKKIQFAVIGLGRFGSQIARELAGYGNHVLGIDSDERLVSRIADVLQEAVIADARDEAALREAGLSSYDAAIVAIGSNLEASTLAYMNLRALGVEQVTVKAFDERHARILEAMGAEDIVVPERDAARHIAQRLHNPLIIDYLEVCAGNHVAVVGLPRRCVDGPLGKLGLDGKGDLHLIGVLRNDRFLRPEHPETMTLVGSDRLLLQGSQKAIRKFADS